MPKAMFFATLHEAIGARSRAAAVYSRSCNDLAKECFVYIKYWAMVLAASTACGSSEDCNLVGCKNGFALQIDGSASLPPGSYVFEVALDNVPTICTRSIPTSPGGDIDCSSDSIVTVNPVISMQSGTVTGFEVATTKTPTVVSLVVRYEEAVVASESVMPTYGTSDPDGAGCSAPCRFQSVSTPLEFE